ncbi:MAG: thiol reductant ABC exporter subunit CydD [Anaerolineae bacterium]|nr:thiol reductant ABC exporter subunit CydD [Anaerolineae bacterium]
MKVERRLQKLNKQSRRLTSLAIGCGVAAALLLMGQAVLLSETINRVFLGNARRTDVTSLFVFMLILLFGRTALIWIADVINQRAASHLKRDLRGQLSEHILRLGPAYTVGERSGELVHTAISGVENLDEYTTQYVPARILAVIVPVLVFLAILVIDPWTSLVLLFAGPMLILVMALIGTQTKAISERRFEEMNWMSAFFLDILQGLPTLKLYGRSQEQTDSIRQISEQYGNTTMDILRTAFQTSLVMEWAATAATAMVALEVSLRLMNGALPFNQALAVLLLTPEFFLPLRQMALKYHAGTAGKTAADQIFSILDKPVENRPISPSTNSHPQRTPLSGDICLHNISLAYAEGKRPALNGISLTIPQGQTVALVGKTGAGKSSVAHLLLRFVEPDAGVISVGGLQITTVSADAWRSQIAWVPQNPHLFHGSVAENLRLARPHATQAELIAASQAAHAHDFIQALPQGYDTAIGEQGVRLSGGQRQRLAIARAYLKDAPFLILDEATANLDADSEALVRDSLVRLTQGRTALIISHRLHMVADANEIVLLENGRILEHGNHQTLLAQRGPYHALTQAYAGSAA